MFAFPAIDGQESRPCYRVIVRHREENSSIAFDLRPILRRISITILCRGGVSSALRKSRRGSMLSQWKSPFLRLPMPCSAMRVNTSIWVHACAVSRFGFRDPARISIVSGAIHGSTPRCGAGALSIGWRLPSDAPKSLRSKVATSNAWIFLWHVAKSSCSFRVGHAGFPSFLVLSRELDSRSKICGYHEASDSQQN